jgi:hypothetical protein
MATVKISMKLVIVIIFSNLLFSNVQASDVTLKEINQNSTNDSITAYESAVTNISDDPKALNAASLWQLKNGLN